MTFIVELKRQRKKGLFWFDAKVRRYGKKAAKQKYNVYRGPHQQIRLQKEQILSKLLHVSANYASELVQANFLPSSPLRLILSLAPMQGPQSVLTSLGG